MARNSQSLSAATLKVLFAGISLVSNFQQSCQFVLGANEDIISKSRTAFPLIMQCKRRTIFCSPSLIVAAAAVVVLNYNGHSLKITKSDKAVFP